MKFTDVNRTIRLGVIGLGGRGYGQTETLLDMPDVEIAAVCDKYQDRTDAGVELVKRRRGTGCFGTTDYRQINRMEGLDAVVIMTDWELHARIAIDAMRCGKAVAMEVGPASSLDECWSLVHTSEDTGLPCMMLENGCYEDQQVTLLNMVRRGVFGELVYCAGGYQHDLRWEIGNGDLDRHYRQHHFLHRNGEIYPTHELGPISKLLKINRGNRIVSLTAMSSKAAGLHEWFLQHRPDRPDLGAWKVTQGDVVGVLLRCANGELIQLTHDCTLPRPFSQDFRVQGTKGVWREAGHNIFIEGYSGITEEEWDRWDSDRELFEKYRHPLWKAYEKFGMHGGHGGLDYLTLRAFVEVIQKNGRPPIDVYDTAVWMAVGCLSEQSIALGGMPVAVPDFTSGDWLTRGYDAPSWYSLDDVFPEEFEDLAE